jgi:hypothetical protein
MIKKMVLPLVVCGMMCATSVYAQDGDIIGFRKSEGTISYTPFTTPGQSVEFKIRFYGTIVMTNMFNAAFTLPKLCMEVGTDGSTMRYATLLRTESTALPFDPLTRTDLIFEYIVQPGDMADPLKIYGGTTDPKKFLIAENGWVIYKAYPGNVSSQVVWQVNNDLYNQPGPNGIDSGDSVTSGDFDLNTLKIKIQTLRFDTLNPPTLVSRQPATTWRIQSGAVTNIAINVVVWTPHTNLLQIVGATPLYSLPGNALEVTIPAYSDSATFQIRGLSTNAISTNATVYAQRPSDYAKNGTVVTNFITNPIQILPPGAPTISLQFRNGQVTETNGVNTGEFKIVLSEADTSPVFVEFDIQPSTATNITIPIIGGYFVPANAEESVWYPFSVKDGTVLSSSYPFVLITPMATNTIKYTERVAGVLNVVNAAPTVQWNPPSAGFQYTPVTFTWSNLSDVMADMAKGITFTWDFGDGSAFITSTNYIAAGSITKSFTSVRQYQVKLTITDADGASYTLPTHTITINPPIPGPNISVEVNRADGVYLEGDTSATYRVVLSEPAQQNMWVQLKCQYWDATSADACLSLSTTNIFIRQNATNSIAYSMTILDGTFDTASGIDIMPTVTNAAAQAQYPSINTKPGIVIIQNVAPTIDTIPTSQPVSPSTAPVSPFNAIEVNKPFTFRYRAEDISADKTGTPPISVMFTFPDGTTTNSVGVIGSATKTFTSTYLGLQEVTMTVEDKDHGVRMVTFPINVIPQLPIPWVKVSNYPVGIAENDTTSKDLTITLSQSPASAGITDPVVVDLFTQPGTNNLNGSVDIPTSVTFYSSETTKTIQFTVQDGTRLSQAPGGFTVTPSIAPTNAAAVLIYKDCQPGRVSVQNIAPVIQLPINGSTNTVATIGQPCTFNWSVGDVAADLPGMTLVWSWGDGTPNTTTTGASGSTNHIFNSNAATANVTVTATDKDGASSLVCSFYVTLRASKTITALPIGPNATGFNGFTGLGLGSIAAPEASRTTFDGINFFYTFYFGANATDAQLIATPSNKVDGVKQSYFFAWDGPLTAFQNPLHVTKPLAPAVTRILFPSGTATGPTANNGVDVSAIFSIEFAMFDGCGDINQDGIPDNRIQTYFIDPTAAVANATAMNPIWLANLRGYNEDNDFYPVYPTGDAQGVMDFRPIPHPNTDVNGVAVNAFTAFKEIRGYDGVIGRIQDLGVPRGNFNDDPGTNPTLLDTDKDGYPDGWEYWFYYQSYRNGRTGSRYNPFNIAQGDRIAWSEIVGAFDPRVERDRYSDTRWLEDFDNDGLLDSEELTLGTDPTNWDTDADGMADGWEILRGFNPCDGRDGLLPAQNNPDGDYFAISTALRQHIQVVISSNTVTSTNHYLAALDATSNVDYTTLTTAYRYGNDTAPWAVGRSVSSNVLTVANQIAAPTTTNINALILHFQVRDEKGFDPRTAWVGTLGRFEGRYTAGGGAPAAWMYDNTDRFGIWVGNHAPNTRPFTAVDEYLLMKFMYELQLNGMVATNNTGWIAHVEDHIANNESTRLLVQDAWTRFTTHPQTPDTDATQALSDGVPDGWELYMALPPVPHGVPRPPNGAFINSPWDPNDHDHDIDVNLQPTGDAVTYQSEFWGTDSLAPYQNAALYYGGMTNANPMQGVITIQRPAGHADTFWVNKFWPIDPWNPNTDGDAVADGAERAFIYGNAVDNGGVCIAGGGLNPCSVDTDRDALPDAWENQFAGTPVAADGTTTLPPVLPGQPAIAVAMTITNGQDGTVADVNKDVDLDGLFSYQEYMTQSIRAYRYDIPAPGVTGLVTRQIGQPMDSTFEIGSIFTEVTNTWDQTRIEWPPPPASGILWWMRPAGARYCSTDPSNPDSDYDGMDDYYEVFHGVNPLLGNSTRIDRLDDRVAYAYGAPPYPGPGAPPFAYDNNYWVTPNTFRMNFVSYPWLNGMPDADPDADGLLNLEEMLAINMPLPENQNTDPSPLWMTDPSNLNSITARFYAPWNGLSGYRTMFFWPVVLPPIFTFRFEMNEGYDTDNDGVSDKDEQVANRNTKSDPRDSEDPLRRQAIWFSGMNSAATTPYMYTDLNTIAGLSFADMEQAFRSFTVELWVRPEWVTNFTEQILIERAFDYGQSDAGQVAGSRLRRNFLIGIAPDGRVFGGFDNAGGHDEHTDSVRLFGEMIVANTWVHLAARMDGRTQKFTLFVNGVSQGEMSTTLIPATGLDPARYYPTQTPVVNIVTRVGTLIMGAANVETVSLWVGIGSDLALARSMYWLATWPDYEKFYRGWMDEVRVWDGARSNQEINDNFRKRLTRDDINANRTKILAELNSGAARNALSLNNFLSPILMNYYTFNNLFSAHTNQYVAQVPRGFNGTAVNANRPNGNEAGATVGWWAQCAVKNTVYNNSNSHYLPWIENIPAHMPRVSTIVNTNGVVTFVNDNVIEDSIYWTRRAAGTNTTQNSFPNNNNPYGFTYITTLDALTYYATYAIDLLPIGDAWAKQCVDFWDDQGAAGNWLENSGTTDDGLPTWWTTLHGATGLWNDLYNGTNAFYRLNGMTYGEVYQRDLAKGMLPSATSYLDYNTQYAQTADSNGDGMPDWWKRLYGLSIMDKTGDNGPVGDPDKDGLPNYSEYLITEVYQFRYSNPLKFKTNPAQPVSDYFMKPDGGKLIYGAMFADHDFIEDWWEEMYSPTAANPYVFDSKIDYDADGWSNWAESRYSQAIAAVRPDLPELIMVGGASAYEFPIPIVDTRLHYKGVQTGGNVVIQAFATPAMDATADATWNIAFGQNNVQANTQPLGFYADKTIRTHLSPGSVVPNTLRIRLTDTWTGGTSLTGFDMDGVIYSMMANNVWNPIGTINYITGEMVFNMGYFGNVVFILNAATYPAVRASYVDASLSYFEMTYSTKLPAGWPQHIFLGRAATGALKEGKNYFFAFIDADGNGAWDAGEPAGIPTPFETDIGWDENALNIQLTDYTPYNLRLSLTTGLRSEDIIFGTSGNTQGGGTTAGSYQRVRIVRSAVQTSSFTAGPIFDKTIFGRDYIHEGDLMTMPVYAGFGLDWGFKGIQYPNSVGLIEYKVYVGEQEPYYNSTLVATFTNKFDGARAVPASVLPMNDAYVYTARPTFSWSVTSVNGGYNAFAFELRRSSATGPLVYPITTRQAPLKNTQTGNYVWEAPFYMGDKNVVNNGVYYWRVQVLNPRYSTTSAVAAEWSSWRRFRWDVNQPMPTAGILTNLNGSSSGYGQLRAVVKYFGAATGLTDRVVLQAFNNRGFTGLPAAQYTYETTRITSITNTSLSVTNQIFMRGLTPATYYVRAFIDSNTNNVLDTWESWGYANYYGENKALYDVRPLDVSFSAISPLAMVYIEDSDTDQDWFPDAYEYDQNPASTNFMELTGPNDGWSTRGDSEINPGLTTASDASSFMRVVMSMASGSSSQQAAIFNLVVDGSTPTTTGAAVTIQKVSFGTGAATLNWDLTPEQTTTSPLLAFFPSAPGVQSVAAPKSYTYNVRYSASLATPRSEWAIVQSATVTEDANGTQKGASTVTDNSVSGTNGFFYIEVVPIIE